MAQGPMRTPAQRKPVAEKTQITINDKQGTKAVKKQGDRGTGISENRGTPMKEEGATPSQSQALKARIFTFHAKKKQ